MTATLVVAALALLGPASRLHVHRYVGHDHPEHHHGPAAHSHGLAHHHQQDRSRSFLDAEDATHIESCDPGEHVLPVVFTCVSVDTHDVPHVMSNVAVLLAPSVRPWLSVAPSDVRAHSPPGRTYAPLRAPPAVPLA